MPKIQQVDVPRVSPTLFYDDPDTALGWLTNSFGFLIRDTVAGKDGRIVHAELQIRDGVVMIGAASADPNWASPRSLHGKVTQGICIYVDDVCRSSLWRSCLRRGRFGRTSVDVCATHVQE